MNTQHPDTQRSNVTRKDSQDREKQRELSAKSGRGNQDSTSERQNASSGKSSRSGSLEQQSRSGRQSQQDE